MSWETAFFISQMFLLLALAGGSYSCIMWRREMSRRVQMQAEMERKYGVRKMQLSVENMRDIVEKFQRTGGISLLPQTHTPQGETLYEP